jgi:uncharacterized protein
MDITPLVPKGRQIVQAYGDLGFRVSGVRHEGSVWILPELTLPWAVRDLSEITVDSFDPLIAKAAGQVAILIVGTGTRMLPLPPDVRKRCREGGIALEFMDTGAACRTYNVLLTEERQVAAALIAI